MQDALKKAAQCGAISFCIASELPPSTSPEPIPGCRSQRRRLLPAALLRGLAPTLVSDILGPALSMPRLRSSAAANARTLLAAECGATLQLLGNAACTAAALETAPVLHQLRQLASFTAGCALRTSVRLTAMVPTPHAAGHHQPTTMDCKLGELIWRLMRSSHAATCAGPGPMRAPLKLATAILTQTIRAAVIVGCSLAPALHRCLLNGPARSMVLCQPGPSRSAPWMPAGALTTAQFWQCQRCRAISRTSAARSAAPHWAASAGPTMRQVAPAPSLHRTVRKIRMILVRRCA